MAILKSMLEETILSKSEQAVLRMLTRCAQLNEGVVMLEKLHDNINVNTKLQSEVLRNVNSKYIEAKTYLQEQIAQTLCSYRFKANVTTKETIPNPTQT